MPQGNLYTPYERTKVETSDQRQLILLLYDGSIRFMNKAIARIDASDIEAAHNYLVRSRDILGELLATLKPEKAGEIGTNLQRLYVYIFNRLVQANLTKDREIVAECIKLMSTLREGWASMKPATQQRADAAAPMARRVSVHT